MVNCFFKPIAASRGFACYLRGFLVTYWGKALFYFCMEWTNSQMELRLTVQCMDTKVKSTQIQLTLTRQGTRPKPKPGTARPGEAKDSDCKAKAKAKNFWP